MLVRLFVLGPFRLEIDGLAVTLPTRKADSLFAYLALHPEPGGHSREKLAALLWGDFSDESARVNLRKALSMIRKAGGDGLLLAERERVQIHPALDLWVDALALAEEVRQWRAGLATGFDLGLYGGDLLSDFYDEWIDLEREHYRQLWQEGLKLLAGWLRGQGEYERLVEVGRRILALDPAEESAHQHLMFAFAALGDRNAMQQQYEACVRALRSELDVEPSPETQKLYQSLKQTQGQRPAAAARLTNLPRPLTSFVGREQEIAELLDLLAPLPEAGRRAEHRSGVRLLTLIGAGGSGKTRLAIEAASAVVEDFAQGVWWVDLASLAEAAQTSRTVANALGLQITPGQPIEEALVDYLAGKHLLLVLDNCEHLAVACARLAEFLLAECPRLQILATSREPLAIAGEQVWPVSTLPVPTTASADVTTVDELAANDCVRLFVARAQAQQPAFRLGAENADAVAEICRRLDGIPLAIELAAARVRSLSVTQIARRLDDRFGLLTSGSRTALPRQQTLRNLIGWSYDLLGSEDQALFRRLAVFSGGWDVEAAEAVGRTNALDLLGRLVDKSLVIRHGDDRYGMLETIREYARERLIEMGEMAEMQDRHLAYYLALAETAAPKLHRHESAVWLDRLEIELDNLRAALAWGLDTPEATPARQRNSALLAAALWPVWFLRGYPQVGERWLGLALAAPQADLTAGALADLHTGAGTMAWLHNNFATSTHHHEMAFAFYRGVGNDAGAAFALNNLGVQALDQGHVKQARDLLREAEALARTTGSSLELSIILSNLALPCHRLGEWEQAQQYVLECLGLARAFGDKETETTGLINLAEIVAFLGDLEKASHLIDAAMVLAANEKNVRLTIGAWWTRGWLFAKQGFFYEASNAYRRAIQTLVRFPNRMHLADALDGLGVSLIRRGGIANYEQAAHLLAAADVLRVQSGAQSRYSRDEDLQATRVELAAQLSAEVLAAARAQAENWSRDEVIAFALATN